jgi:hypothetical protein
MLNLGEIDGVAIEAGESVVRGGNVLDRGKSYKPSLCRSATQLIVPADSSILPCEQ